MSCSVRKNVVVEPAQVCNELRDVCEVPNTH